MFVPPGETDKFWALVQAVNLGSGGPGRHGSQPGYDFRRTIVRGINVSWLRVPVAL